MMPSYFYALIFNKLGPREWITEAILADESLDYFHGQPVPEGHTLLWFQKVSDNITRHLIDPTDIPPIIGSELGYKDPIEGYTQIYELEHNTLFYQPENFLDSGTRPAKDIPYNSDINSLPQTPILSPIPLEDFKRQLQNLDIDLDSSETPLKAPESLELQWWSAINKVIKGETAFITSKQADHIISLLKEEVKPGKVQGYTKGTDKKWKRQFILHNKVLLQISEHKTTKEVLYLSIVLKDDVFNIIK